MKRVEAAINQGVCVLAVGGRALQNPDILMELRRRPVPAVALGAAPTNPVQALKADTIAPALNPGGIIVLVEPEGATDGAALGEIAKLIKGARNKPRLFVAAKAFNPFAMPMSMRLLKLEQLKMRAQDFVASLPVPTGAPAPAAAPAASGGLNVVIGAGSAPRPAQQNRKSQDRILAPKTEFVGREEEREQLKGHLDGDGGPIVLVGPAGSGRRWLVERTLADAELTRIPDVTIARGSGADTLAARVALAAKEAGHDEFDTMLREAAADPSKAPAPKALAEAFVAALQHEGLKGSVLVVHHLHRLLDKRDNSFYREGRLEMMLRHALQAPSALRLVLVSEAAPTFYREGDNQHMRVLNLAGIRGKELHQLFEAWHAPEFPRDRFGPISERTHGHPLYNRHLAISVREGGDIDDILERPKFLRAAALGDLEQLERHLKKRLAKLSETQMAKLCAAALLLEPAPPQTLQTIGISRQERLELLAMGVLEQTPVSSDRRYYVHPIIRANLDNRKVNDFPTMEELGRFLNGAAATIEKKGGNAMRVLTLRQDGNRLLTDARRARSRARIEYPDTDPIVETVRGILRRRNPRYDIARMRVNEGLKASPRNTEMLLCDAELRVAEKKKVDEIQGVYNQIAAECPTPEAVHHEASYHISRNARGKAIDALVRGVELFPGSGRLRRRLAGLYLRQNRLELAVTTLKAAADSEPMMPDNYSMLGEVYVRMGAARWEEADQVINEARRIDPENPIHRYRAANLLRARALIDAEGRAELLKQADELLQEALKVDQNSARILTLAATIILDQDGEVDLEKANWLLKKATRKAESVEALTQRARLALRKGDFSAADKALNRAYKKDGAFHPAYAIRAELLLAQGDVFRALEAYKTARERSPRIAPERAQYEAKMAELNALIESGQVTPPQPEAVEGEGEGDASADGPRRDAGKTVVRRTADGKIVDVAPTADADGEDAPAEAAPAEDSAEAAPAEDGAEAAPVEEEAAPVEVTDHAVEPAGEAPVEVDTSAPDELVAVPSTEVEAPGDVVDTPAVEEAPVEVPPTEG